MMRFMKFTWLILVAATFVISSCERRPLEDAYPEAALIPVGALWSKANIAPQNVTVLVYNQDDGELVLEHRYQNNSLRIQSYLELAAGKYTVVLFNEIRDQIDGVGIRGHENFSTLEAYGKPNNYAKARAADDNYIAEPGVLASVLVSDFEVTGEMVRDDKAVPETLVGLVPERKIGTVHITMHVKGLNNARMPALVDMRNMAGSYLVGSDNNSMDFSTHQFNMNNRTYDAGSTRNGTISATIYTFGVVGNRLSIDDQPAGSPILLDVLFMLVDADKTIVNRVVDVTRLIRFSSETTGSINIEIDIELPDALPDVVPEGSGGGSGFEPQLTDWSVINVPLTAN